MSACLLPNHHLCAFIKDFIMSNWQGITIANNLKLWKICILLRKRFLKQQESEKGVRKNPEDLEMRGRAAIEEDEENCCKWDRVDPGVSWEKVGIRKAPHLLIQEFILPVFWQTQSDSASRGSSGSMGWPSSSRVEKLVPNSKAKKNYNVLLWYRRWIKKCKVQ